MKGRSHCCETQIAVVVDEHLVAVRGDFESDRRRQLAHFRECFSPYFGLGLGFGLSPSAFQILIELRIK